MCYSVDIELVDAVQERVHDCGQARPLSGQHVSEEAKCRDYNGTRESREPLITNILSQKTCQVELNLTPLIYMIPSTITNKRTKDLIT